MKNIFKLVIIILLSINLWSAQKLEKVSLQLDWKYQFEHAGFIMAKEKGFYKEVGLDTTILEYKNGVDIEADVLSKKVDFGISNTALMVKNRILQPVVLLATYLQRSPLVFVTQLGIKRPSQLDGKKIMATEYEYKSSSLALSLLMEHFFVSAIYVPHNYRIDDFKNKKIDAMSVFTSNELYELDKQNIPYNIIDPYKYGFVTNAMNLFTSYSEAKNETRKVKSFIEASRRGWQYALDNTDETIKIIHQKYNHNKSIEALKYEAKEIKHLMLLNLYDIGEVSQELITRLYKQLLRSGKILPHQKGNIVIFGDMIKEQKREGLFLTKNEINFLDKKGTIKLCVDPDWMPFEGLEDGKYVGMIADYFDLIREKSGIKIEVYKTKNWDESIKAIKKKECDIIGSASPTPSRLKYMDFTDTYMKSPIVLITKVDKSFVSNIEDITDKRIGIPKGYAIAEILRKKYPQINIIDVKNIDDGLRKVENGELYGYIDNLSVTVANIKDRFNGVLKVSARLDEYDELTIGSRNDEPMLNQIFQKVIDSIDKSKVRSILNRWISVKESTGVDYILLWRILGFVAIIFLFFILYSYQLKQNNIKLEKLSREDALTGIGNRLKLNEVLEDEYKYSQRYRVPCGVIILDIDDFKKVNDTHGHLVGDRVLKQFAQILLNNIRETDKLGRWGGEEFLIVCPNTNKENLINVAEGLRKNIEKHNFSDAIKGLSASFGLSLFDAKKDIEEVLNEADENLYKSKSSGKNRVYYSN